jgi:hypothetical protein
MVVIVDDENPNARRFKQAPPVDPKYGRSVPFTNGRDDSSLRDFALTNRPKTAEGGERGSDRSGSPYTLRID